MIRPSHVVCFLAILAQFVFAEWARSQETDKKLERIAADWKRRQERFTRVQYEVRGNVMIPRENIMDERNKPIHTDSESGNIDAPFSWTLLLDFENNRHRLVDEQHYYSVPEKKLFKRSTIAAFDGKSHWVSIKRDGDPERKSTDSDIAIRSGDLRVYRIGSDKFPAFYGHGIVPYAGAGRLFAGQRTLTQTLISSPSMGRRCIRVDSASSHVRSHSRVRTLFSTSCGLTCRGSRRLCATHGMGGIHQ